MKRITCACDPTLSVLPLKCIFFHREEDSHYIVWLCFLRRKWLVVSVSASPRMWFLQREDCHFIAWFVLSGDTGIKAGLLWLMFCRTGCFHFAVVDIAVIGNGAWNFQDLFSLVSHLLGCLFAYDTVRKGTLIMQSYPSFPSEFLQSVCLFCL